MNSRRGKSDYHGGTVLLTYNLIEQRFATQQYISVGVVKVTGIPRVGNTTAHSCVRQQQTYFTLRIALYEPHYISYVHLVHSNNVIVLVVICHFQLHCPFAVTGYADFRKLSPCAVMHRVAYFLGACSTRSNIEFIGLTRFIHYFFHHKFRHR